VLYPTNVLRFFCIIVIATAILASSALAQDARLAEARDDSVEKYQINMYIAYDKVLVESAMLFPRKTTANFSVDLPFDARKVTNEVDKFEYPAIVEENRISFYLKENRLVKYSYITEELLEGESFIGTMTVPFTADNLKIKVSLPENAVLEKPVRQSAIAGSAVYPKPKRLDTDGQVITILWEFDDVKAGEEIALYARYKEPVRVFSIIIGILAALAILGILAYLIYKATSKDKRLEKTAREPHTQEYNIEKHLKDNEEQVINILKLKEGRCEQGTLRIATGFSKAKLSGLLKELEARKIIHKEKRGKKNLVFLK
jgi:uncharacterized membrane protein